MTSERSRFPVGLTLSALIVFAICLGLGVWQLQRAGWKAQQLAKIEALRLAAPQPIGPVLARAARGENVAFTRVAADCAPAPAATTFALTSDRGDWIARAMDVCHVRAGPYDGVVVERGLLTASRGATAAPTGVRLPPPAHVVGALLPLSAPPPARLDRPAPLLLVAEQEAPPPPGVVPAPFIAGAADNLQYVGAYAPTWFGLAGVVLCVYAAMLWRRFRR